MLVLSTLSMSIVGRQSPCPNGNDYALENIQCQLFVQAFRAIRPLVPPQTLRGIIALNHQLDGLPGDESQSHGAIVSRCYG
jgi:hypothetical protein